LSTEKRSVEELNGVLERGIQTLKTEKRRKALEKASEEMNTILYEAIEKYPNEANAVSIPTKIYFNEDGSRYGLRSFLESVIGSQKLSGSISFEFVKHLPYVFTTGTHGSGERMAGFSSCPNLSLETDLEDGSPAGLRLDLADGNYIGQENVFLPASEIQSISLERVADEKFTPRGRRVSRNWEFKENYSGAAHYIYYMGFCGLLLNKEDVPEMGLRDEVVATVRNVLVPDFSSRLFSPAHQISENGYFSGFAVDDNSKEPVLYEFENAPVPKELLNDSAGRMAEILSAYTIAKHKAEPQTGVKTYNGDSIIARLSQIESKRIF